MGEPEPVGVIVSRWWAGCASRQRPAVAGGTVPGMSGDEGPRIWLQLQVVYPRELGGHILTKQVQLPVDQEIADYGKGTEAMVNKLADDMLDELAARKLP